MAVCSDEAVHSSTLHRAAQIEDKEIVFEGTDAERIVAADILLGVCIFIAQADHILIRSLYIIGVKRSSGSLIKRCDVHREPFQIDIYI